MSHTSIYENIKKYLLEIISNNKDDSNFLLPSEQQLSIRFSCSRVPARRALNDLCEQGLINRIPGRGSFIKTDNSRFKTIYNKKNICLLVPTLDAFSNEIIAGISEELLEHDAAFFCYLATNSQLSKEFLIDSAISKMFDGLIVFPNVTNFDSSIFNNPIIKKIPMIFVTRRPDKIAANVVCCKDEDIIKNAAEHLVKIGHEKIGLMCDYTKREDSIFERINTYKKCMSAHGLNEYICTPDFYNLEGNSTFISEQICDFFTENSDLSALVMTNRFLDYIDACIPFHNTVIDADSLIIIDRPEPNTRLPFNRLTYIDQMPEIMGRMAAKQILNKINKGVIINDVYIQPRICKI